MWRSSSTKKLLERALCEKREIIAFDTETTGLSGKTDQIIQFSAIKFEVDENFKIHEKDVLDVYIKPREPISDKIIEITGITNELLSEQEPEEKVFPIIKEFLGEKPILLAHNISFDTKMTSALYERMGELFEHSHLLDTLSMARDLIPKSMIQDYKLATIAELYGFDDVHFHSAIDDVSAMLKIFGEFLLEYSETEIPTTQNKKRANIKSCQYWEKHSKNAHMYRIYVNTDLGTVYFNISPQQWEEKDKGCMDVIDMEALEQDVFAYTKTNNHEELRKWRK